MGINPLLLGNKLFNYKGYLSRVNYLASPQGISSGTLIKAERYPGPFIGATIVTNPFEEAHRGAYVKLNREIIDLSERVRNLTPTPIDSYHATLHSLFDLDVGIPQEPIKECLRNEISYLFSAVNQSQLPAANFVFSGYAFRVDAVVMMLEPLTEADYLTLHGIRERLCAGEIFKQAGIGIGRPDVFHITLAYQTGFISGQEMAAIRQQLIKLNGSLPKVNFPLRRFYYSEFENLDAFPQYAGMPVLSLSFQIE